MPLSRCYPSPGFIHFCLLLREIRGSNTTLHRRFCLVTNCCCCLPCSCWALICISRNAGCLCYHTPNTVSAYLILAKSFASFIIVTMPSKTNNGVGVQVEDTKICVVMVGLPARGKSYIAQLGMLVLHFDSFFLFILLFLASSELGGNGLWPSPGIFLCTCHARTHTHTRIH